ncbi:MAG: ankyrin repeat domain-containing protein [Acidobacteriota bacterium]|nr:ankyrin repeat domain-containing protein [Acidobacteriota bacterium]MDE2964120.1 ankyrin repeat domain-containing protein [Acidobacteriota bacterium]
MFRQWDESEARILEKFGGDVDKAVVALKLRPRNAKQKRAEKLFQETNLHKAAAEDPDPWGVDYVIDLRAIGLEERDGFGRTPLHVAAWFNKNPAVIEFLLKAGADLEARDPDGDTPLHLAAWFNDNPAVIEALLKAGADREVRDRFGRIPWDYAQDGIACAEASGNNQLARQRRQAFEAN